MTEPQLASHPIGLIVDDDLERSRLTVFFRQLLVIPQAIWIVLWWYAVIVAVWIAWLVGIFTGRVPEGLHGFISRWLRASTQTGAYSMLLANPWPPFMGEPGGYPVDLRVDPPVKQSRLTIFFRSILAIPALLISAVFRAVNFVITILGWFYCLATGRMHEGMRNASAWMFGYELQTLGYLYLVTDRYPSFAGGPSA